MKRVVRILVFGALIYAGWLVSLHSCANSKGNIVLDTVDDSLSYAVSMLVSEDLPAMMKENGIDSTTVDDFLRGLRTAFPLDDSPESEAYVQGVAVALEAAGMLKKANEAVFPDDNDKTVDKKLFLEGVVAAATGDNTVMSTPYAIEYYNRHVFRARSEQFIKENAGRPGVVTLPSGVQYKVVVPGDGKKAGYGDVVKCVYKGTYPNGAIFDSSRGEAAALAVSEQVPGLAEVLTLLPAGTKCMAYIPWELAYGAKGKGKVPPYSTLVYDLEILDVE